ncbi:uncharacterized protein DS421_14g473450 [Arachis hypogaea]|nr:uncharacterized protein DS421_14g473450 [Arachis hypogaea]
MHPVVAQYTSNSRANTTTKSMRRPESLIWIDAPRQNRSGEEGQWQSRRERERMRN